MPIYFTPLMLRLPSPSSRKLKRQDLQHNREFDFRVGWCPDYISPFFGRTDKNQMNSGHYIWGRFGLKSFRKVLNVDSQPLSELHSGISVLIYFQSLFCVLDISVRPRIFKITVFVPLGGCLPRLSSSIYRNQLVIGRHFSSFAHSPESFYRQWKLLPTLITGDENLRKIIY